MHINIKKKGSEGNVLKIQKNDGDENLILSSESFVNLTNISGIKLLCDLNSTISGNVYKILFYPF